MSKLTFLVEIEVERETGKFAGRDEIAEAILEELGSSTENADLSSLGMDGTSVYNIVDVSISELDKKELKALWKDNEERVVAEIPGDAKLRAEVKSLKRQLLLEAQKTDRLQEKLDASRKETERGRTNVWYNKGSAFDNGNRVYLSDGKYNRILFALGDPAMNETLSVERREDGALEIRMDAMGRCDLIVRPTSSNVIVVEALAR